MRNSLTSHIASIAIGAAAMLAVLPRVGAQTAGTDVSAPDKWPGDIDRKSGMRLPIPDRDSLDEAGKRAFDRASTPGASIAGLQGPGGVQLYLPKIAAQMNAINRFLRFEAGFTGRQREIAILITARELNSQFEWVAHEQVALKEGVPPAVIDIIKHRKPLTNVEEGDAIIIELGREMWRDHKVKPETFARAKAHFGATKLVELGTLMGNYAATGALLSLVDMQLHAGSRPSMPIP